MRSTVPESCYDFQQYWDSLWRRQRQSAKHHLHRGGGGGGTSTAGKWILQSATINGVFSLTHGPNNYTLEYWNDHFPPFTPLGYTVGSTSFGLIFLSPPVAWEQPSYNAEYHKTGLVDATFGWDNGGGQNPHPGRVVYEIVSSATAQGYAPQWIDFSLTAENGLGHQAVHQDNSVQYIYRSKSATSSGRRVVHELTTDTFTTESVLLNALAFATAKTASGNSNVGASVAFNVQPLQLPTLAFKAGWFIGNEFVTYRKGPNGERILNTKSPDGTMTYDIGLGWIGDEDSELGVWCIENVHLHLSQTVYNPYTTSWDLGDNAANISTTIEKAAFHLYVSEDLSMEALNLQDVFGANLSDPNPQNSEIPSSAIVRYHKSHETGELLDQWETNEDLTILSETPSGWINTELSKTIEWTTQDANMWFIHQIPTAIDKTKGISAIPGAVAASTPAAKLVLGALSIFSSFADFFPKDYEVGNIYGASCWDHPESTFQHQPGGQVAPIHDYVFSNVGVTRRGKNRIWKTDHYDHTGYVGQQTVGTVHYKDSTTGAVDYDFFASFVYVDPGF